MEEDYLQLAEESYQKGVSFFLDGRNDQALEYFEKAANYFSVMKQNIVKEKYVNCYLFIGMIYNKKKQYSESNKILNKARELCNTENQPQPILFFFACLALVECYFSSNSSKQYAKEIFNILIAEGLISHTFLTFTLQRELTQTELSLAEQKLALEQSEKLNHLGLMATGVAHNINNPVGIIQLAAKRGLRNLDNLTPEATREILEKILRQTDRLDKIIKNFRKFAQGDRHAREIVALNPLVQQIEEYFSSQFENHRTQLILSLAATQPQAYANQFLIQEILINLITNAHDSVEQQTQGIITVHTTQTNQCAVLTVTDNGAGIPEAQQAHIFSPFHSSKASGTGLGLYFAYQAAKELDGNLQFTNQAEGGACFTLLLPLHKGEIV